MSTIALIAFGSLLNNSEGLDIGLWKEDGPILPLEFCRVSSRLNLTLAINEKIGTFNSTHWSLFKQKSLKSVLPAFVKREKIREEFISKSVGIIDVKNKLFTEGATKYSEKLLNDIINWAKNKKIDYVVFSSLSPRFKDATGIPFSPEKALMFIQSLPPKNKKLAVEYIKNTKIITPFRLLFNKHF